MNPSSSVGVPVSYVNLGAKGFVSNTEEEVNRAFDRTFSNYFYSLEAGSHYQNTRRLNDAGGTYVLFDIEWDGSQWLYAIEGSYETWKTQHYLTMAQDEQRRREEAESAGENYAERAGYWDESSGTWMFDN